MIAPSVNTSAMSNSREHSRRRLKNSETGLEGSAFFMRATMANHRHRSPASAVPRDN